MLIEGYETMLINDKLEDKTINMKFAKTAYISSTNMTLVSLNKLKKKDYVWNMKEDVLIHQKSDQKVCNIEEHYDLATIEFNPVDVAVEKTSFLAKEDASEENPPIVAKEDAPTEKKMDTEQKEDASTLKKSDTDLVLAAVAVASGGEISVDQITPASD
jgi:hypothetical protein